MYYKKTFSLIVAVALLSMTACNKPADQQSKQPGTTVSDTVKTETNVKPTANNNEQILAKKQIPILCYHRIKNGAKGDYTVSETTFGEHVQVLADSGYHSISPDQLYDYLVYNKSLPDKPFMITFDDSREEHYAIAGPVLEKHGFRGVFFIMTITYNKKNYMTTEQIAEMAKAGHTIGLHSWDHTMAIKYKDSVDWKKEVRDPQEKLSGITGQPVDYWAYPNGVTNREASAELSKHFKLSFILSTKRDSIYPLQTVRRIIVPDISGQVLLRSMRKSF